MRVGIAVPQSWNGPARTLAELARFFTDVESGPFDSVWVQEQLLGDDPSFEPLAMMAFAAALTKRVRIGSAGIVAPLRSTPALAKAFATIDQLSLGRLDAGIVIGEVPSIFAASGIAWEGRGDRFEDVIVGMRSLWQDDETTRHSSFSEFVGARMNPRPVQAGGPPLWVGAKRRASLDRVARLADGWLGAGGAGFAQWKESKRLLDDAVAEHGRAVATSKKVYLWVDRDERIAVRELGRWFEVHWQAGGEGEIMARSIGVAGTPERLADHLMELAEAGADLVMLNPVGHEREQLERLCSDVLPLVPTLAGAELEGTEA